MEFVTSYDVPILFDIMTTLKKLQTLRTVALVRFQCTCFQESVSTATINYDDGNGYKVF